jgi:hemerythrin-like metal-binding protein
MALLQWRDEFNTGIPSVDFEHQSLFGLINDLHRRLEAKDFEEVEGFMAALHDRISAHFALEERLMRDAGYDGYAEHKADHEKLLDEIRDLMEQDRAGAFRDAVDRLSDQLERWFSVHFSTLDARFHRGVNERR